MTEPIVIGERIQLDASRSVFVVQVENDRQFFLEFVNSGKRTRLQLSNEAGAALLQLLDAAGERAAFEAGERPAVRESIPIHDDEATRKTWAVQTLTAPPEGALSDQSMISRAGRQRFNGGAKRVGVGCFACVGTGQRSGLRSLRAMNRAMLIGRLGKDPEIRFTPTGKALCKFPLATSEKWTDGEGTKQERTTWHNIIVWGKLAEICGQYLAKGRQACVVGSIQNRTYDDRDGNKKYITEINAREVEFLGGGDATRAGSGHGHATPVGEDQGPGSQPPGGEDDDIPF